MVFPVPNVSCVSSPDAKPSWALLLTISLDQSISLLVMCLGRQEQTNKRGDDMAIVYNGISVAAHINWPEDGFVQFTFIFRARKVHPNCDWHVDSKIQIVEALSPSLCLSNTREHEASKLDTLVQLFEDEDTVLYLMHEALSTAWTTCPHCGDEVRGYYNQDLAHNCSAYWVPAEWRQAADSLNTSESVLRAISEVTGWAFSCRDSDFLSVADHEWHEGVRALEILKRAFELEEESFVYWGSSFRVEPSKMNFENEGTIGQENEGACQGENDGLSTQNLEVQ